MEAGDSHAVIVIMRSPMVALTRLMNPGMASSSMPIFLALSLTAVRSVSVRASRHVTVNAPGVAVLPFVCIPFLLNLVFFKPSVQGRYPNI